MLRACYGCEDFDYFLCSAIVMEWLFFSSSIPLIREVHPPDRGGMHGFMGCPYGAQRGSPECRIRVREGGQPGVELSQLYMVLTRPMAKSSDDVIIGTIFVCHQLVFLCLIWDTLILIFLFILLYG